MKLIRAYRKKPHVPVYEKAAWGSIVSCYQRIDNRIFGFHTFAGDTGWLAKAEIEREILVERSKLAQLKKENLLQRHRIELLKSHQLDADMLSEIARSKLGLFSAKDVIVSIQVEKL